VRWTAGIAYSDAVRTMKEKLDQISLFTKSCLLPLSLSLTQRGLYSNKSPLRHHPAPFRADPRADAPTHCWKLVRARAPCDTRKIVSVVPCAPLCTLINGRRQFAPTTLLHPPPPRCILRPGRELTHCEIPFSVNSIPRIARVALIYLDSDARMMLRRLVSA